MIHPVHVLVGVVNMDRETAPVAARTLRDRCRISCGQTLVLDGLSDRLVARLNGRVAELCAGLLWVGRWTLGYYWCTGRLRELHSIDTDTVLVTGRVVADSHLCL